MDARNLIQALAVAGALTISGCGTVDTPVQEQGRSNLTQDELKALLSTTRTVSVTAGTFRGTGVFAQDGTAHLQWNTGSAKGTWRIDGNKFCTKYPGLRRGYETCYSIQKTGVTVYTLHDDSTGMSGTWVVEK